MIESFRASSNCSHIRTNTAIYGITLRFLEFAAWDDGDGSTMSEDVAGHPLYPEVIEL